MTKNSWQQALHKLNRIFQILSCRLCEHIKGILLLLYYETLFPSLIYLLKVFHLFLFWLKESLTKTLRRQYVFSTDIFIHGHMQDLHSMWWTMFLCTKLRRQLRRSGGKRIDIIRKFKSLQMFGDIPVRKIQFFFWKKCSTH